MNLTELSSSERHRPPLELYFIRHGESETNATGTLAGQLDVNLTPRGMEEARELGAALRERNFRADLMITSGLRRAQQTAHEIALATGYQGEMPAIADLNERFFGTMQGGSNRVLYDATDADVIAAGGESLADFATRLRRATLQVRRLAHGITVVVAHAEVYRMLDLIAQGRPLSDYATIPHPPNAELLAYPLRSRQERPIPALMR